MPKVKDIPFRSIPHQSKLFLDYVDLAPSALRFYQSPPTMKNLLQSSRSGFADLQCPKREMASILRRQNERFGGDDRTFENIDELENPDCVAILTGQQVGLFAGPLYTIYKALTAVHIAAQLKRSGVRAVPAFWMDTEDHDLAEVTHCTILDPDSQIRTTDYRSSLFEEAVSPNRPVGSIPFPEKIKQATTDYVSHLAESIWKPEVQDHLEATYSPKTTFAQAFARLLSRILKGFGLILFDPQDMESKRLVSPLFRRAIHEAEDIYEALVCRKRELEAAGFNAQVKVLENSSVLFLLSEGERHALERRRTGFGLKNSDRVLSKPELLRLAEQMPEQFSPNVLLRPVVQDHLFPTLAYIGGPAEVAYAAQTEVLYTFYGRPMPVIWPRNSYTLIEPEVASAMDRLGVGIEDCFLGKQHMTETAMRHLEFSKSISLLDELEKHLDQVLTEIRPEVEAVEPPLVQALETSRRKIMHNVRQLRSRIIRLEGEHNSSIASAIDLAAHTCYPNQHLQERTFGVHHFLSQYGTALIHTIHSSMETDNFTHRILYL